MVHWLELTRQTRAYVLVDAPEAPRCVILGFHGYAERPAHCLEGLRRAEVDGALLVGPMGQHHFYNREGKVVCSWMTKFNREHQVEQIVDFSRGILDRVFDEYGPLPLYVFGFSQGASSAYRAAALAGYTVRRLFALAGDLPPELRERLDELEPFPVSILHGSADLRVPAALMEADERLLEGAGWSVELLRYEGDHAYEEAALRLVGARIEEDLAAL